MTTLRSFTGHDLFRFNNVNLDYFTETYNLSFYLQYLARWPEYCLMADGPGGQSMGYIIGKSEGTDCKWHGHVTAVTVSPTYRRQRLAEKLMSLLEDVTENFHKAYFVDLFVRVSNVAATGMYHKLGYSIYRKVIGYYSNGEDAYDMRKAMTRDVTKGERISSTAFFNAERRLSLCLGRYTRMSWSMTDLDQGGLKTLSGLLLGKLKAKGAAGKRAEESLSMQIVKRALDMPPWHGMQPAEREKV